MAMEIILENAGKILSTVLFIVLAFTLGCQGGQVRMASRMCQQKGYKHFEILPDHSYRCLTIIQESPKLKNKTFRFRIHGYVPVDAECDVRALDDDEAYEKLDADYELTRATADSPMYPIVEGIELIDVIEEHPDPDFERDVERGN